MIDMILGALIAQAAPCTRADAGPRLEWSPRPQNTLGESDESSGPAHTIVTVFVRSTGSVSNVTVQRASGSMDLDNAALNAARHAKFLPATRACTDVDGTYSFLATFSPYATA